MIAKPVSLLEAARFISKGIVAASDMTKVELLDGTLIYIGPNVICDACVYYKEPEPIDRSGLNNGENI